MVGWVDVLDSDGITSDIAVPWTHLVKYSHMHMYLTIIINIASPQVQLPIFVLYCLNSFWPSDAWCRQRSESTLAQVMACCLTAPSHYNQCWLIISEVQVTFILGQCRKRCLNHQSLKSVRKLHISKLSFKFPRGQWVKGVYANNSWKRHLIN